MLIIFSYTNKSEVFKMFKWLKNRRKNAIATPPQNKTVEVNDAMHVPTPVRPKDKEIVLHEIPALEEVYETTPAITGADIDAATSGSGLELTEPTTRKVIVAIIAETEEVYNEYPSMTKAATDTGASVGTIRRHVRGEAKTPYKAEFGAIRFEYKK
jgi:hypothetical protein